MRAKSLLVNLELGRSNADLLLAAAVQGEAFDGSRVIHPIAQRACAAIFFERGAP